MRYPDFLKSGDTIGFTAPSFGCNIEPYRSAFDHAQEIFREKGYSLLCGETAYAGDGIGISSTPEKCGKMNLPVCTALRSVMRFSPAEAGN